MNDHESATPETPVESTLREGVLGCVLEFFAMRRRLADAKRRLYAPSDPGFREFELGLFALKDALQLGNSQPGRDTALLLYRSAIRLFVRSALLRRALGPDSMSWSEVWALAGEVPGWPAVANSAQEIAGGWLDDVVKNEQGELHLAKLSTTDRERALVGMAALAQRLAAPLEQDAAGVRRLTWQRRTRAAIALFLVVSVSGFAIEKAKVENNLALHRPVVVSDIDPNFPVDPRNVVDGDRLNLGFHTGPLPNTTLTIDLETMKSLSRIEVYNRGDCCQERTPPLAVQLSSDGRHYETVARKGEVFQHWSVALPAGTRARFIRLLHPRADFFHLAEVEAY